MPYSDISQARIKKLDDVPLTLSQINSIAKMADAIGDDKGWAIAISNFKKTHKIDGNSWVESKDEEKEYSDIFLEKEDDGRYKLIAVSTAALEDREGETFTTEAMDHDIQVAKETGEYPEFRVFHKKGLGIGKVTKMSRVGIFAVDEGYSYTDPFSLNVCEKMLANNRDGKWKVSRGFKLLEAAGNCPDCGSELMVRLKHMVVGFRCPRCKSVHLSGKGSLNNLRFLKTKTFDLTVTDIPAVPWTGVAAFPYSHLVQEVAMTKEELKKRLLKAGLDETVVDSRLESMSADSLKEFEVIPDAVLLKEFESDSDMEEDVFTLDPETLKEFSDIVDDKISVRMKELLDGMEIEVEDSSVLKEFNDRLESLENTLKEIKELLESGKSSALKEKNEGFKPRKFRVLLNKQAAEEEEDEEDMDEEEDPEEDPSSKKKLPPWLKKELETVVS